MYADENSEWILEAKSRESRSIQCQPAYKHGTRNKVFFLSISREPATLSLYILI